MAESDWVTIEEPDNEDDWATIEEGDWETIETGDTGKLGFGETILEDPVTGMRRLPFDVRPLAMTTDMVIRAKRLQKNTYETVGELTKKTKKQREVSRYAEPLYEEEKRLVRGLTAFDIDQPSGRLSFYGEQTQAKDAVVLTEYFDKVAEVEQRGYTLGGRVGQILGNMPAFAFEFLATGGLKQLGTKTAQKFGERLLGQYAKTKAGSIALKGTAWATGVGARAFVGMPHRMGEAIFKRQMPEQLAFGPNNEIKIEASPENWATSIYKGLLDHYIEVASEEAGGAITKYSGKLIKRLPLGRRLIGGLQKAWLKLHPNKAAMDFAIKISSKAGFHGVYGELGEERLATQLRAIFDVEDFGAGPNASMLERMWAGVGQDVENLPAELIAFTIPGVARGIPGMIKAVAPEVEPVVPVAKEGAVPGQEVADYLLEISDQPEMLQWAADVIKDKNFEHKEVLISDLIESDPDVKEHIEKNEERYTPEQLAERTEEQLTQPIILANIGKGTNEVLDGLNRIFVRYKRGDIAIPAYVQAPTVVEPIPATADEAIGKQYGLTPVETNERLGKAELRYRELKTKPVADRTKSEKKELAFLKRNRKNIEAILERETRPIKRKRRIKSAKTIRNQLLSQGHILPRKLGMTETERRRFLKDKTGLVSMEKMTPEQMQAVIDAFRDETIARGIEPDLIEEKDYGKPIVVDGQTTTMETVVNEAIKTVDMLPSKVDIPKHVRRWFFRKIKRSGLGQRMGRIFYGIDNAPLYELANILEQSVPGVLTEVFDSNIQRGRAISAGHKHTIARMLKQFFEDNGVTPQDLASISESANPRMFQRLLEWTGRGTTVLTVEINDRKYDMTPAELLDIYLIARQEDGSRHIHSGGLVINGVKTGRITKKTLTGITELVEANPLLMQLVDAFTKTGDIWKETINNVSLGLEGREIATVENWWGLEVLMPKKLAGKKQKLNVNLIENKSILKDRTKATEPLIVRDALQRFTGFENAIAEYVGMAEATRIARTLINDTDFGEMLRTKGYEHVRKNIYIILERAQSAPPTSGAFDRLLGMILPGVYRSVLFFNPRVVMSQYTSVTNYQAFVSAKYAALVAKGLSPEAIQETLEMSDIAWDRFYMGHSSLELGELAASDATLRLLTQTSADKNKLGITLRMSDMAALAAGMQIAKAEYLDAQNNTIAGESALYWARRNVSFEEGSGDWKQAVTKRAEWLWHRSQPSWDKWSRSVITSDSSAIKKLFFLFRSFHEKSLTILHGAHTDYINSSKTLEDKARFAKKYGAVLSGYTLNTVLRAAIMAGMMVRFKDPFDYIKDIVTAPFAMLPILGHILGGSVRAFVNALMKYRSEYRGEAIESLPVIIANEIARAPVNFNQAAGYYIGGETEKANKSLKRAVGNVYTGIGMAMGVPVFELERLYKRWIKKGKTSGLSEESFRY